MPPPSDDADEPSVKRQRVAPAEENEENYSPPSTEETKKEEGVEETTKKGEQSCAICFEPSTEVKLLGHECCGTCKPDGWRVCKGCNGALLSRLCPFCKGDYASLPFHLVGGYHLSYVRDPGISVQQKLVTTLKIEMLKETILPSTNALVILSSGIVMFSLATKSADANETTSGKQRESTLVLVRAKIEENKILQERLVTPEKFLFNNAIWDLIEKISEEGNTDDNYAETLSVQEGSKKMILGCMQPEAKLYVPVDPEVFTSFESSWIQEISQHP